MHAYIYICICVCVCIFHTYKDKLNRELAKRTVTPLMINHYILLRKALGKVLEAVQGKVAILT